MATKNKSGKSWFSVTAKAGATPEILIYDEIGLWGITAKDFNEALKPVLKEPKATLRMNSPGGDVFVGFAIFNMLERYEGELTVVVDGVVASIASLIAMAADRIVMPENAMMMIHNPKQIAFADAKQMRDSADFLDRVKEGMLSAYAKKTGNAREAISEMMDAETWFTAQEAVDGGFADEIEGKVEVSNLSRFDLSKYLNPPKALLESEAQPEESDMTKDELEAAVTAGNGPVLAALNGLTTALTTALAPKAEEKPVADPIAVAAAYVEEVSSLCTIAGRPEDLADFLKDKKPVAEVRAALAAKGPKASSPALSNHNVGEDGKAHDRSDLVVASLDHAKVWSDFHSQNPGRH